MNMLKSSSMKDGELDWLKGQATLGATTRWTAEEIRLVTELGFGLAEQGKISDAVVLFEGLTAVAPATVYFQAALGALWLRSNEPEKALFYLDQVVQIDPKDLISLVNRGESLMRLGNTEASLKDLNKALTLASKRRFDAESIEYKSIVRAKALRRTIELNLV